MTCFESTAYPKIQTPNRFIRSATCEYMADENGAPTDRFLRFYDQLAGSEIGIVITGYAFVMENGQSNPRQSGIHRDDLVPEWEKVTRLFDDSEGMLVMQIVHGGRQVRAKGHKGPVWAPSALPDPVYKTEPVEMTEKDTHRAVEASIEAAVRVEAAGFDGVQLHIAHGYLLSQFISPFTNRRLDCYGGNQRKRCRMIVNIIQGIKKRVDDNFLVTVKLNAEDFLAGGLTISQAVTTAMELEKAGVHLIEVSGGMAESKLGPVRKGIERVDQEGYFRHHAWSIRQSINIPVAVVGGFRTLSVMEETVQCGCCDFISISRPFVREPDLVSQFRHKGKSRADCISCNGCFNPRGLSCSQINGRP